MADDRRSVTTVQSVMAVEQAAPQRSSILVSGEFPDRRGLLVLAAVLGGFLLTVVWSAPFVDDTVGDNVANTLLGHDAAATPISGIAAGVLFAFVTGLAGSFTACNIAALSAVAPLLGAGSSRWERLRYTLVPLGWLSVGMLAVSATYGAVVALVGTRMPQFSTERAGGGRLSPPLIQAMVVFGVVGLALLYLGLIALGLTKDPFARISARFPMAPMLIIGVLIGGFLIGRPFPLFRELFRDAANSGNPLYGAAAFSLQSIGNIVVIAGLFVLITVLIGGRAQRWLGENPRRAAAVTGVSLLAAAAFLLLYWDVRLLNAVEIISGYPLAPWV